MSPVGFFSFYAIAVPLENTFLCIFKKEVIKIEQWLNLIGNFGFPIVVTFYLLLRFEKKIDHLTEAINKIATSIEKEQDKQ
ncbi:YvrJ family protein [Priestia megaterium]|uniref:YvrJ family protein n=1 Tax=Priestia megaterium TaxID=1404 RepID=UPI001C21BFE5|nr:YvrJ family protein [Priestia megaterium]MBU8590191.1 YvrJ family protein [Priestia megaterium]